MRFLQDQLEHGQQRPRSDHTLLHRLEQEGRQELQQVQTHGETFNWWFGHSLQMADLGVCRLTKTNFRATYFISCSACLLGCTNQAGCQGGSSANDSERSLVPQSPNRIHCGRSDSYQTARWGIRCFCMERDHWVLHSRSDRNIEKNSSVLQFLITSKLS